MRRRDQEAGDLRPVRDDGPQLLAGHPGALALRAAPELSLRGPLPATALQGRGKPRGPLRRKGRGRGGGPGPHGLHAGGLHAARQEDVAEEV